MVGISIREFARRDGCSDTMVRKRLKSGHLLALSDGKLDPELVGSAWRPRKKEAANRAAHEREGFAAIADPAAQSASFFIADGRELWSTYEAERIKENYAALLRQLSYDRESAKVVEINDVIIAVRQEYCIVRGRIAEISANVVPHLVALRSPELIKAAIDAEVTAALMDLSDIVR